MAETLVIKINGNIKNYQDALKKVGAETQSLEDGLASVAKGSAIAFGGLALAIGGAVNEAAKVETMTTQFEILTGSVAQADKTIRDLQEFSAKTPFQMEGIGKASTQLLGFGFEADELIPKLQMIGDVASAANKPIEEVGFIFGQVAAAGKLTGERLLQFQERAIPIGPAIAKTLGVAESAVKGMVSRGEVDFKTFEKAFASLSQKGGFAFEGMIKQSKTFAGVTSTLGDNFSLLVADVGKELLPMFKKLAIAATKGLQFLRRNKDIAKTAATILSVSAAVTGAVVALTTAGLALVKFRKIMMATRIAVKAMSFSIKGLLGATGIGLLVVVLTDLALNWEKRFAQMQAIFHGFAKNVTNIGQGLAKFFTGVFTLDVDKIKEGFSQVKSAVVDSFTEIANDPAFTDVEPPIDKFFPGEEEVNEKAEESTDAILNAKLAQTEAIIAQDEELKAMLDELSAEERSAAVDKLSENIESDKEMRDKALKERFVAHQKANKQFLKDQEQFGKTFALINQFMHSDIVKGTKKGFGELQQLTKSNNKTLKGIGKAAAVANIIIQTAQSAMNIFTGFSAIPIVGIPLGIAGAAAAVAFGAEQIGQVTKAAKGGLLSGGIPGVDSINVLAQKDEFITPAQSFEEVIGSVRAKREADAIGGGVGGGSVGIHVTYDSPEASQIITVSQVEDTNLGISQDSFKEAS